MRIGQADILKAMAIISVIIIHGTNPELLRNNYSSLHISQPVPVFVILMGFLAGLSAKRKGSGYSREYILNRIGRFWAPFIAFSLIVYYGCRYIGFQTANPLLSALWGGFSVVGPGDYFVFLVFQFAIVFPTIYAIYRRKPKSTLITGFVVAIVFEIIASSTNGFNTSMYYYANIFHFMPAIMLGIALSEEHGIVKSNLFIVAGAVFSAIFLVLLDSGHVMSVYGGVYVGGIATVFYPAFLVMIGLNYLPGNIKAINTIGKASYHIFMVQTVYFALNVDRWDNRGGYDVLSTNIFNLCFCIGVGLLFYYVEKSVSSFAGNVSQIFATRKTEKKLAGLTSNN
jgi:peptidoglycan/LPS O-acetylase OafA/YrhL